MLPNQNRTSGTYGLPLSPSSTAFDPSLVTRTGSPIGRRRSHGAPSFTNSSSPLRPVFEETIGFPAQSGLRTTSSVTLLPQERPSEFKSGISYSNVKAFLANPLAIPTNRPYLRLFVTLLVYGLSFTVITNLTGHSAPEPAVLLARLKGTRYSGLADWEILDRAEKLRLHSAFPHPPDRPLDRLASPNDAYRALHPLKQPPKPFPELRATKFLPDRCLEGWFIQGEMLCSRAEVGEEDQLDVTYLWVNGSDPRWQAEMIAHRTAKGVFSPEHHFRENNELMYSMRSVLANMPGRLRTIHLITADYKFELSKGDLNLLPRGKRTLKELEDLANETLKPLDAWVNAEKASAEVRDEREESTKVSSRLAHWLETAWRVAQVPTWLDFRRIDLADPSHPLHHLYQDPDLPKKPLASHLHATSHPSLRYAVHSEIFHLPTHKRPGRKALLAGMGALEHKDEVWRNAALPTFNSMAIESRIGWLWGLADVSLSFNDDFFMLRPHAVSDWWSTLYGTVLRLDYNYFQQVRPALDKKLINNAGETGGLYHANYLLGQRFPKRLRPYFAHVPKVITRGLHHEASIMFEDALSNSALRKFREMAVGEGDVQMQWLLTSLRIERWREALLWTWAIARVGTRPVWGENLGGQVGVWGDEAREDIMDLFGVGEEDDDVVEIEVHRGERWTLETDRMAGNLEGAGWEAPKNTEFLWSAMDGHIPPLVPNGSPTSVNDRCTFGLERCLGRFWSAGENVTADDMFKRLAFSNPACGDCLIMALVTASGPLGLSAVFPPEHMIYRTQANDELLEQFDHLPPPHLPLTSTWQAADFSLENVLRDSTLPGEPVGLRKWSMQLLSRYLYTSGRTQSHFHMARSPAHVQSVFAEVDSNPRVALLGFNDDIDEEYDRTRSLMIDWFRQKWPIPAVWEKGWTKAKN